MSKLERLLNLTAALLETRRPMTAEELHRRIPGYPDRDDSFRRTFERDKDDLREMGIPIELVENLDLDPPVVGYRIPPDRYYLPDPGLLPDELAALQIASLSIRLGDVDHDVDLEAVRKLGGSAETPAIRQELAALPRPPHLDTIFAATTARQVLAFAYGGVEREVEPHRLDFSKGRWYLGGFDRTRSGDRRFRLDRIEGDVVPVGPEGAFERPEHVAGVRAEPWELGEGEPVVARLLVDAAQAPYARNQLPEDTPWEERADGSAVATVRVVNPAGFRSFVLSFLDHAEILDPPSLRDDLTAWLFDLVESS